MNKNQLGFGAAGILIIILVITSIGGIGWTVLQRTNAPRGSTTEQDDRSSTEKANPDKGLMNNSNQDSDPETYSQNKSKVPGEFINTELRIRFIYPKNWKLVNDSSHISTLFRLQSPDFKVTTSADDLPYDYIGTQISVSSSNSATYAEVRTSVANPPAHRPLQDVRDIDVNGRNGFSYFSGQSARSVERSFTVVADIRNKPPLSFIFQPSDAGGKYYEKEKPVFDDIVRTVEYL